MSTDDEKKDLFTIERIDLSLQSIATSVSVLVEEMKKKNEQDAKMHETFASFLTTLENEIPQVDTEKQNVSRVNECVNLDSDVQNNLMDPIDHCTKCDIWDWSDNNNFSCPHYADSEIDIVMFPPEKTSNLSPIESNSEKLANLSDSVEIATNLTDTKASEEEKITSTGLISDSEPLQDSLRESDKTGIRVSRMESTEENKTETDKITMPPPSPRVFIRLDQEVRVFIERPLGGGHCITFYPNKIIGQEALSATQFQEDLKDDQRRAFEIQDNTQQYQYWVNRAQRWLANSNSRNEATAKSLVQILGPMQKAGLIRPDECVIL